MQKNQVWNRMFSVDTAKYPSDNLIRFIAKYFYGTKTRNKVKILEIGSGGGCNLWFLSREGFDTYGIDISDVAISKAKDFLNSENCSVNLTLGDISKLNYPNKFFDAVIDNECLYSNDKKNSTNIINEIKRVLKINGLFYSRTYSLGSYVGKAIQISKYEFKDSIDGPFMDTGSFRLSDNESINDMYGKVFSILSIDELNHTRNNGKMNINELVVIAKRYE